MRDKVNDPARLVLMKESIANIYEFLKDVNDCESFISNKILCHAVIYNLQCIGESVYKLSKDFRLSHTDMNWDKIEGLRHVLVHDYYTVDFTAVWYIIEKDLPALKNYLIQFDNS